MAYPFPSEGTPSWMPPQPPPKPPPTASTYPFGNWNIQDIQNAIAAKDALAAATEATAPTGLPPITTNLPAGMPQTWADANGTVYNWDPTSGQYVVSGFDPTRIYQAPMTGSEQANLSLQRGAATTAAQQWQQEQTWQQQQGQQQLAWYQQQAAMQEAQAAADREAQRQERLATLKANPQSWLEYSLLANETPAIQPWMLPLMPQQYSQLGAGGAIPNWQAPAVPETLGGYIAKGGTEGNINTAKSLEYQQNLRGGMPWEQVAQYTGLSTPGGYTGFTQAAPNPMNMPALTPPSRQYQSRMGPTALAQYQGYERARIAMTPEEQQYRLWSSAPPSGAYGGLTWSR